MQAVREDSTKSQIILKFKKKCLTNRMVCDKLKQLPDEERKRLEGSEQHKRF